MIQFLVGLNDSYKVIRGKILMMTPLPSIATIHSLLIHEERQKYISSTPNLVSESIAMNVSNGSKKNLNRSHCKKNGHLKSQCYRLHGFPTDFNFTKGKKTQSSVHNFTTSDPSSIISLEQYKQLMQLLNNNNGSKQIN